MKKYIDLVDISNIAYEAVHSVCGYKGKNLSADRIGCYLDRHSEKEDLMASINQRLADYSKSLSESSSSIIIVFDAFTGKSKRFSVYPEYKDGRGDKPFDPKEFKKTLLMYRDLLKSSGIITIERTGVEADDIITELSRQLFSKGLNVRINSRDSDLIQLVESTGKTDIVFYNPLTESVYAANGFALTDNEEFEMAGIFDEEISTNSHDWAKKVKIVNPHQVLLEKVISGDKTDNIPSCIHYTKGVSKMGITEDRIKKVMISSMLEVPKNFGWEFVNENVIFHINESVKTKKEPILVAKDNEEYLKRFSLNLSLVRLDSDILDEDDVIEITTIVKKLDDHKISSIRRLAAIEQLSGSASSWENYDL